MHTPTRQTYDRSADAFAEYFAGIGHRGDYVDTAAHSTGKPLHECDVLELGCGDGRDAAYIAPRAKSYVGYDYSIGLLAIAQRRLPDIQFHLGDIADTNFGTLNYDLAIAFASVLHLNSDELSILLKNTHTALRENGVLYISTKEADVDTVVVQKDQYGERLFYYYSQTSLRKLADGLFRVIDMHSEQKGFTSWIETTLRKTPS